MEKKEKELMKEEPNAKSIQMVLGDFHSILEEGKVWKTGGFTLPDGSFWAYREPEAVVIVRNDTLYVRAKLSRENHQVQILDNAKHMYYSAEPVEIPEAGEISFELQIRCRTQGTAPGDLYDGYVSLNLLDFTTGAALDFLREMINMLVYMVFCRSRAYKYQRAKERNISASLKKIRISSHVNLIPTALRTTVARMRLYSI